MKKILILTVAIFLILAGAALAANTTTIGSSGNVIEIIPDGSTDWVWSTDLANKGDHILRAKIKRIVFYPSAASDRFIIHDGGIDNAAFFDSGVVSAENDPRTIEYNNPVRAELVIDATDNTTTTPGNCKVLIFLEH